jgi:hypothetical protein
MARALSTISRLLRLFFYLAHAKRSNLNRLRQHVVFADAQLHPFATNHRIISFTLYTIGFVGFVMSLKKGYLKQQFGLFCWVHMSLLLVVVSR